VRRREDDLTAWQGDPVVQALTGPATGDELAGEEAALAAFRAAVPVRSRRRFAGRLGVGGSALAIAVALSGGVAAAYTSALPAPLQRVAYDVGGWLAVPPPDRPPPKQSAGKHKSTPTPTPSGLAPTPSTPVIVPSTTPPTPSTGPSTHHHVVSKPKPSTKPKPTPSTVASTPPASPPPSPTPTPTPTPTSTPIVPGSITITVSSSKVPVNSSVSVIGHLATSSGAAIVNHQVWLIERLAGANTASEIASGVTGSDGSVTLTATDLTRSVRLRLVVGQGVHSAAVPVIVMPTVSVALSVSGSSYVASVTTDGGQPGDTVELQRRTVSGWVAVTSGPLDSTGGVAFSVQAPVKRTEHYRVVLPRTRAHGFATARFATPPL
jgi:hypothetical protein